MKRRSASEWPSVSRWLGVGLVAVGIARWAAAREFPLGGVTLDLQEVTTNLDVYFTAMRFNRAANEWDVEVTLSNKASATFSGPVVLLVDRFTGTSGALRPDGVSAGQAFFDLSPQLTHNALAAAGQTQPRTLALEFTTNLAPQLVTRVFAPTVQASAAALGFTRSLNQVGQPLAGVTILESGPAGSATNTTDPAFGVVTLGPAAGHYTWQFNQPGYLPVWRQATLISNQVTVVPYPWLTTRNAQSFPVSPLTGGTTSNQTVQVQFAPASVSQNTTATMTALDGQTLPALLPQGWSPLQAFWLELDREPTQPAAATLTPWGPLGTNDTVALVRLDPGSLAWQTLQLVTGHATNALSVVLPGSGAYALVVADATPVAPPAAVVGSALSASAALAPDPTNFLASGTVTPATSPASPMPELVTATADVAVTNITGSLASGTLLRGEVSQSYQLQDNSTRAPPQFDSFIVGYQRPGDPSNGTLHARFPLRPVLLFGPDRLNQADVRVDLFAPSDFSGGVLDTNGGQIASAPVRLLAAPATLPRREAILLRNVSPTNFVGLTGTNQPVLAAFEAAFDGAATNQELSVQASGLPANSTFVLARVIDSTGLYGLEPRARVHSDANGNLLSDEPTNSDRLAGLTGSGQYVLAQVQPQQGLVEGVAKDASGRPAGGLPVSVAGEPWLTFSAADGSFKLLAPVGTDTVSLLNPVTGDTGAQPITVPAALTPVSTSVALGVSGLRVASITPADAATNVPQITSVAITFNRPLNPATLVSNAVQLLEGSNQVVGATFSLDLANTTLTLLPNGQLDAASQFTVALSTNIADSLGRPLQGQSQFTFATVALSARSATAQLIIYEPGATNVDTNVVAQIPGFVPGTNKNLVVVQGTAGAADSGVPVIVVNEGTGETTTILSKSDGSFASAVSGQAQDFISATFVSLNGTRIYVPVNRQLFDDGSVGLYPQGGTLQASGDGGAVLVTVPPNAIQSRTKFKLVSVNTNELVTQLGGVMPTNATVAGGALNLHIEGPPPTLPIQVSFPVDLAALGYPTNEPGTNAAAAVALVRNTQDVTTFEIMDQLQFVPQSSPAISLKRRQSSGGHRPKDPIPGTLAGALDTSTGLLVSSLGSAGLLAQVAFNQVIVPLLFGPRPVTIKGKVTAVPYEIAQQLETAGLVSQIYNLQVGSIVGNQDIGVPLQLAQQMGFPATILGNTTVGNLGSALVELSYQALKIKEMDLATPLSGAFITVSLVGGGLVNEPGRLYPGMVYATSGSDGSFLTVAPAAGARYIATCTHPLFEDVLQEPIAPIAALPGQQGQLSLAGAVFEDFFFQLAVTNQIPPSVQIGNEPVQPAAGQPCQVVVDASQPSGAPNIRVKVSLGTENLLTGQPATNPQLTQSTPVVTQTPTSTHWTSTLTVDQPVLVTLTVLVLNPNGVNGADNSVSVPYQIAFTGPVPPTPVANIPAPDTNDVHGPVVIETDPPDNGFIGEDSEITIIFNKPIDAYVTNHLAGISLNSLGTSLAAPIVPNVRLSSDQQTLALQYPGLPAGTTFQLTLSGQSIRDLAAQPLNQVPSSTTPVSFTTTFRTAPPATSVLPQLFNGRGAVISGNWLYVLDQAPQGNFLDIYDITWPLQPHAEPPLHLIGAPRDLVVIPQFRYKRNAQDSIQTNDLVVVVGGDLGTQFTSFGSVQGSAVSVPGQYLWVINMGDPTDPQVLASPMVSFRVGSAVTKVRWAPPYLVYEENGADIQLLGFVNLQELIFGYGSSPAQQEAFQNGRPGLDLNNDGDYVDPGEQIPIPPTHPPQFFGLDFSYVLQGTTQKILDFSVSPGAQTVGITLRDGVQLVPPDNTPTGPPLPAMYRTVIANGQQLLNTATPTDAAFAFTGAYPRWVSVLDDLQILTNGVPTTINAALVSLEPDTNGLQTLAVLDVSLPEQPKLVNKIPIPTSVLGGDMESVSMRSGGLLELAGAQNTVVLDPSLLAVNNVPAGQLHPAIVDVIPGAGGITRSFGTTDYGVHAVADSGRGTVVQSPPQMEFVSFPNNTTLVDPTMLNLKGDAELEQLFSGASHLSALAPANLNTNVGLASDLEPTDKPPNAALHYYVVVYAPGGDLANSQIDLGLESLNPAGRPLSNLGSGFAPVRAVSDSTQQAIGQTPRPCGAPIRALPASRVSNNPHSVFYNWFLSRPFALITESVSPRDVARIQTDDGVEREILFSGYWLRAFIDPDESRNVVFGPFTAQADTQRQIIYPIATVKARTVNRSYITGDNPPPAGGYEPMDATFHTICAHSGESRVQAVDMALPSPSMPIQIQRAIGNQDTYEGPFGVGWDFNYNQRLTILDPLTFPAGLQMPLVVRDSKGDSQIAGSQDVLFHSGLGETYHFQWRGTNMPPGYAQDPLVRDFDYQHRVSDYYLPSPGQGVFDLLVKFKEGTFERLTPGGMRFRYARDGKLQTILDRFPKNRHELQYDRNGWLVRIDDRSVSAPRYVRFGYCRRQGTDPDFDPTVDMNTANPRVEGKICRLLDYAGGDVLFQYDSDGFLTNRLGIPVNGENGGYAGRSHTFYSYRDCKIASVSATVNGTPIVGAVNTSGPSGKPVALSVDGIGGQGKFTIPVDNSAANVGTETTAQQLADKSTVVRTFDKWGHVASETVCDATTLFTNSPDGLLLFVNRPEGNSDTMVYDSNDPVFRSRGNLLSRTVDPGPRGGSGYTETFQYDPRYNLKSGAQTTADGFVWTYTLSADGRSVSSIQYGNAGMDTFSYNDNGQLTSHTDIRGVTVSVTYDFTTGSVNTRKLGDSAYTYTYGSDYASQLGRPSSIALPEGAPIQFQYNANLQATEITRGALDEKLAYDEQGRPILRQTALGDGKVLTVRNTFDEKEFLRTNIIDGVEVNGQVTSLEWDLTPDPLSRLQSIRHPQGTVQSFGYDCRGNVKAMTNGDYVEEYTYDLNDNRVTVKQGGDLVGQTAYDGLDQPATITRKTGTQDESETRTYYPGGELLSRSITDPQFGVVQAENDDQIDALGRNLHVKLGGTTISPTYQYTYPSGSETVVGPRSTTTTTWNSAGYETGLTEDTIVNDVFHPDSNGHVRQIDRQEDGATYNDFFTFDDLDNRTSASDNLGTQFLYLSRAEGSLLAVTNALGHVTTYDQSVLSEVLSQRRADGMTFQFQHDPERFTTYAGDPGAGFHLTYDRDFRLATSTLRNSAATTRTSFDPRNMPTALTIPGGSETRQYDLLRRLTQRKVTYQATAWEEDRTYDALNRVRAETYIQNGGANDTASFTFDEGGPLLQAAYHEDGADFTVAYSYYGDGTRKSVTYPSGVTITENRDATGRLTGVSDANGNIISASAWQGNEEPKVLDLGATMRVVNSYDARGRLNGSRVTRLSDGAVLAHMRYQYDAANNLLVRQFVHRGGRADVFNFDLGERVSLAQIGVLATNSTAAGPALYQRQYNYHASGLDYLTTDSRSGPLPDPTPFATNWTAHDNFLLPGFVDGVALGSDPMGNVSQMQLQVRPANAFGPQSVSATLQHDGLGRLVTVTRADGVSIQCQYRPNGLRFSRKVFQAGALTAYSAYVYDETGRLIEEYDRTGAPVLIGRYYYGNSDAPAAADLRDPSSGQLRRYYFLRDAAASVIAVADQNGNVVERAWYDTFGQPAIERRDTFPPVVQKITADAGGALLISMSEPVVPAWFDPGPGGGVVTLTNNLQSAFTFQGGITGAVTLVSASTGTKPFSVVRFTPSQTVSGSMTLGLAAGTLSDEWDNTNAAQSFTLTNLGAPAGTILFTNPSPTDTSPVSLARSDVGSPFLFHGQYFDYDTGLIYLRARFYDPYSGMFLEPDPLGYEDSVNLYAGMGNNPVSARDPSGLARRNIAGQKIPSARFGEPRLRVDGPLDFVAERGNVWKADYYKGPGAPNPRRDFSQFRRLALRSVREPTPFRPGGEDTILPTQMPRRAGAAEAEPPGGAKVIAQTPLAARPVEGAANAESPLAAAMRREGDWFNQMVREGKMNPKPLEELGNFRPWRDPQAKIRPAAPEEVAALEAGGEALQAAGFGPNKMARLRFNPLTNEEDANGRLLRENDLHAAYPDLFEERPKWEVLERPDPFRELGDAIQQLAPATEPQWHPTVQQPRQAIAEPYQPNRPTLPLGFAMPEF